jgi:hypothetical protein
VVCGVRVENVEDPLMRKFRYLDKLVDELAKGKAMDRILREPVELSSVGSPHLSIEYIGRWAQRGDRRTIWAL